MALAKGIAALGARMGLVRPFLGDLNCVHAQSQIPKDALEIEGKFGFLDAKF